MRVKITVEALGQTFEVETTSQRESDIESVNKERAVFLLEDAAHEMRRIVRTAEREN